MAYTVTGGSNVSVSQKGQLKIEEKQVSITADGTFSIDVVVPAGKVYIPKYINSLKSGGTFTCAATDVIIVNGSAVACTLTSISGAGSLATNLSVMQLELPAGFTFRVSYSISGYSVTGVMFYRWIYQDVTV